MDDERTFTRNSYKEQNVLSLVSLSVCMLSGKQLLSPT